MKIYFLYLISAFLIQQSWAQENKLIKKLDDSMVSGEFLTVKLNQIANTSHFKLVYERFAILHKIFILRQL